MTMTTGIDDHEPNSPDSRVRGTGGPEHIRTRQKSLLCGKQNTSGHVKMHSYHVTGPAVYLCSTTKLMVVPSKEGGAMMRGPCWEVKPWTPGLPCCWMWPILEPPAKGDFPDPVAM